MSDFRRVSDSFWASPQITPDDVAEAASQGFTMIVNNRPDGESDDQTPGDTIAALAAEHGLGYVAIPVDQSGYRADQLAAMAAALGEAGGKVLAYCRSGTRSTFLWSLTQAQAGAQPAEIAASAAAAGYDVSPLAPQLFALAEAAHD